MIEFIVNGQTLLPASTCQQRSNTNDLFFLYKKLKKYIHYQYLLNFVSYLKKIKNFSWNFPQAICNKIVLFPYSFNLAVLEQLQESFKFISILSLYLHYLATFYLFFQINSPTILSISFSILFKYTFFIILLFFYLI